MEKHENIDQKGGILDQNSNAQTSGNFKSKNELKITTEIKAIEEKVLSSEILVFETKLISSWLYQKTENTRLAYETDLRAFLSYFHNITLKEITSHHISLYLKQNSELKASTRSRIKASISSLLKHCVKRGYLDKNPAELLDTIKVPDQTQYRVLAHEEILRMIELEPLVRNQTIIRLLYKTGLRVSELCSLKFSDLRLRDNKAYLIVVGKGQKTRTIGLDLKTYEDLKKLNDEVETANFKDNYIFISQKLKKKLSRKAIWTIIKSAAKRANLNPKVSTHWTRHSHATKALEMGEDLRVIQQTLGHESILTTTKYTNVYPGKSSGEKITF